MDCAIGLYKILASSFDGNKARIKCMTDLLIGLLKSRTINLTKVAINMPGSTKINSKYRKLQRFFSEIKFEQKALLSFVTNQLPHDKKYILILDRTNWKFGKKDTNFLVVSIA
jgi:hypothetical protein